MRTFTLLLLLISSVSLKAKYCAFTLSSNQGGYCHIESDDYPYDTSKIYTYTNPTDSISFLLEQDIDCYGSMTNVEWYKDGILVYSATSTSYNYSYKTAGFGTYTCKFYRSGFYYLTIIFEPINASVADYSFSNNLLVFPNPSIDGLFTIENLINIETLKICISDISGREIKKLESNDRILKINLSECKKGFYTLVCIDNTGRISTKKIIYN